MKRTFRVFVSSTFEDLLEERNALDEVSFPRLSALSESLGARFQAIDLRWGVRTEAAFNQRTMDICLSEVARCQQTGIKPNFLILLGERYGWRPLPSRIDADEFSLLVEHLTKDERNLVDEWYRIDENAIPREFVLLARTGQWLESDTWTRTESRIRDGLERACALAGLPASRQIAYETSATHQEILMGLGVNPEDARYVYAFAREGGGKPDPQLENLTRELGRRLGDNLKFFNKGDPPDLCRQVEEQLEAAIRLQLAGLKPQTPLEAEIERHDAFAANRGHLFSSRGDALRFVADEIAHPSGSPVIIHGASGIGKSALMAAASDRAIQIPGQVVVRRFIGATPESSDGIGLLRSVCSQIAGTYGRSKELPSVFSELTTALAKELQAVPWDRPLSIFVDGMNQLAPDDPVRIYAWLPQRLPPGCTVFASSTDEAELLGDAVRYDLKVFDANEAKKVLSIWFEDAHRRLQDEQLTEVLTAFGQSPLPMHLRLLFEEAKQWRSFDDAVRSNSRVGIEEVIDRMIARLCEESNHGAVLVTKTLAYLCAARWGLSEPELIDVLGSDDEVWSDFELKSHHRVNVRRLPFIVWSRLYYDLKPFLMELGSDEGQLISLFHGTVRERIVDSFFPPSASPRAHQELANHFRRRADPHLDGSWVGRSARPLRELPFHTAGAGESDQVISLLTSLAYLAPRVAGGDAYRLPDDYGLVRGPADYEQWRAFIVRHSQRLTEHPAMLVSLSQLEGPDEARLQAQAKRWTFPWLDSRVESVSPQGDEKEADRLVIKADLTYPHERVGALASQAAVAFLVEGLGPISLVDLREMRELPNRLSIGEGRPVKVACAPDASSFLVILEQGVAELHRSILGSDRRPLGSVRIAQFECCLPEIDDPVVEWLAEEYWMQVRAGKLARVDPVTGQIHEQPLFQGAPGELGAVCVSREGSIFAVLRQNHSTLLGRIDGSDVLRQSSELYSTCACGNRFAAFFTDGRAAIYDLSNPTSEVAHANAGVVVGQVGWGFERLFWKEESGNVGRILEWIPGEEPSVVGGAQTLFSARLTISPRAWSTIEDDMVVLTSHSIVRFGLKRGSPERRGRLMTLFGGPTWRAVRSEENAQWLWSRGSDAPLCIAEESPARVYCAIDGRENLYVARVDRNGQVWDLISGRSSPLEYEHLSSFHSVTGDPVVGCWLGDRLGGVYYAGEERVLKRVSSVREGIGSDLLVCGPYLIWRGTIPQFYADSGVDQARSFVVFRRGLGSSPMLEPVGRRLFPVREGLCVASVYNEPAQRLVLIWQHEDGSKVLRVATVRSFLEGHWTDTPLDGAGLLGHAQMAVSPNGSTLGIVNALGDLACVSIATGNTIAYLSGSLSFTHIATGGNGTTFWLVQNDDRVLGCTLKEPM